MDSVLRTGRFSYSGMNPKGDHLLVNDLQQAAACAAATGPNGPFGRPKGRGIKFVKQTVQHLLI